MTSTELFHDMKSTNKPSSRVLKPPGGGHTNLFGEAEAEPIRARPKYNQQNSSNLNQCMNTVDPNESVDKTRQELVQKSDPKSNAEKKPATSTEPPANGSSGNDGRGRIPPGGFSSGGFW